MPESHNKIRTRKALKKALDGERKAGRRIVFTNGCFDLLHPGHLRTLEAARSLGDILVVGLNSDRSVRRLKGPGRPIIPEAERAELLSAFSCVNYVVVFDDDDPREIIVDLHPDVLAKGGDWIPETILGRGEVEGWGGKVVALPEIPGLRSSALLDRIRRLAPEKNPAD